MKKRIFLISSLFIIFVLIGCHGIRLLQRKESTQHEEITELKDGLSSVRYEGNYGFDKFLSSGGAASDKEVIRFLTENLLSGLELEFAGEIFGCSTITVQNSEGEILFGRNFDWNSCDAMVVMYYYSAALWQ